MKGIRKIETTRIEGTFWNSYYGFYVVFSYILKSGRTYCYGIVLDNKVLKPKFNTRKLAMSFMDRAKELSYEFTDKDFE